jgi:hypothetical protein
VKEWLTNHYRKYFSAIEWLANHYRKYLNSLRITIWKLLQGKARISYAVLKEDGKYANCMTVWQQVRIISIVEFFYLQLLSEKTILEVDCSNRGGIEHIANNLGVSKCVALNENGK